MVFFSSMRHTRARRRDAIGGMTTSRDGGRDRCRAYRTLCFVELAAFKALALGFVVVAVVSEYWLEPRAPARTVPGLSRAGLWRVEYHVGGVDETRGVPRSSVSRFWREVERSFRGLGDDAGREGRPGRAYANLFGRSHATRFRVTQATAIAFVFALALEWIVLVFYFARRRERRGGFATASSTTYSGAGAAAAICACVAYASIVAYVRADTPTHVPGLRKANFTAYLGWGYWMFLTCGCAHLVSFVFSLVEWDRVSKARARRRRRDALGNDLSRDA
jgi:hypothetical protein